MDYRDLAIEIQHREDGGYQAKILSSPRGLAPADASFRPPCEPADMTARLVAMDSQIEIAARNPKDEDSRAKLARDQLRLGQDLYAALFAGKVARIFDQSLVQVRQQAGAHGNAGLRLRLVFDPHQADLTPIAALPWELLYDEETRDFLGRLRSTPIVRYLSVNRAIDPFVVDGPLRVLVVEAQPSDLLSPLDCAAERQRIKEALDEHPDIDVDYEQADVRRLHRRLLDEPFHVLHFMGH
ncbi:MAG: hypothetical protein GY856_09290, partial [bacterium]|nr:hypothetical protein [bacterium]